uniref:Uncharacterized protein n=1 Tax=Oryza nivara TaxID=4536 RepID=A0A0E0J5M8_ORYNI
MVNEGNLLGRKNSMWEYASITGRELSPQWLLKLAAATQTQAKDRKLKSWWPRQHHVSKQTRQV